MAQLNWKPSYDGSALRWRPSYLPEELPEAPSGTVTIGAITPTSSGASVAITYDGGDATGFEYRIDGGSAVSGGSASPIVVSGLSASTEYDLEIRPTNDGGEGAWSAVATFETRMANPGDRAVMVRKISIVDPEDPVETFEFDEGSVDDPIRIEQGGTFDLSQYIAGGATPYKPLTIKTGELPAGVTLDPETWVLSASAEATPVLSDDVTFEALDAEEEDEEPGGGDPGGEDPDPDPDPDPPEPGDLATTFSLTSASTGTVPFTLGMGFGEGDATNIVCDLDNYQVDVKRRWLDGSVKHAVISGRAALTADTPLTVNVTAGTPPSGSAMTEADIIAAAPTASVQCGAFGTVSLADLLGSPVRTWIAGPEMVECHYRADVGGGTLLSVWFHVRLYADGRMRIRATVENGYLDNGSGSVATHTTRTYDATVTIGGTEVFDDSITHYPQTSWMAEGWIGGDPGVTALHDVEYLAGTKLVPNYAIGGQPSSGTLDALPDSYTPMMQGSWTQNMGQGGYQPQLGMLTNWDALYCKSGDVRALRAVEINSHAHKSYRTVWRTSATKAPVKPSSFPTWTYAGPGGSGTDNFGAGSLTWEINHSASAGYLAYLLTGDYSHLETLAFNAATTYTAISSARGSGVNRFLQPPQTRGIAWSLRNVAQYAALAPDGDDVAADYRTMLANSYATINGYCTMEGASPIGIPLALSTYDPESPLTAAPWMTHFWIAANGYNWDIEPGYSDKSAHQAVRDFMYRAAVGILGGNGVDNYCFTKAGNYVYTISATVKPSFALSTPDIFFPTWGEVFEATHGSENTACGTELEGTSGGLPAGAATGYWGNLLPAIAYAVDHGATDAAAAWGRLTGATNWSDVEGSGFDSTPVWGIAPRT